MSKERGYKYADEKLKKGIPAELLYDYADNASNFGDFERGILDRLFDEPCDVDHYMNLILAPEVK